MIWGMERRGRRADAGGDVRGDMPGCVVGAVGVVSDGGDMRGRRGMGNRSGGRVSEGSPVGLSPPRPSSLNVCIFVCMRICCALETAHRMRCVTSSQSLNV